MTQDQEWQFFCPLIFAVRLEDGTRINGPVMRRKVHGKWQYRAMTLVEALDYAKAEAW